MKKKRLLPTAATDHEMTEAYIFDNKICLNKVSITRYDTFIFFNNDLNLHKIS